MALILATRQGLAEIVYRAIWIAEEEAEPAVKSEWLRLMVGAQARECALHPLLQFLPTGSLIERHNPSTSISWGSL